MRKTFGRTLKKTRAREANKLSAEKVSHSEAACWRDSPGTPGSFAWCLYILVLAS